MTTKTDDEFDFGAVVAPTSPRRLMAADKHLKLIAKMPPLLTVWLGTCSGLGT